MSDAPRYVRLTEGELIELIERSGPAGQHVPAEFRGGDLRIDGLEPGAEWALDELDIIRREDRERVRES